MNTAENMIRFADELQKDALPAQADVQEFPSGVVWLDVHYAGRLFSLVYLPRERCFGVDEFDLEEHGIGTHFRFSFPDFESARTKLINLLEEARVAPAHNP